MSDEKLLTQKEAMSYLRISLETLAKLRREGLPFVKLGKKVLFKKSDLDAFIEARTVVMTAKKPRK